MRVVQVQVQQLAPAPTHGRTSAEVARLFSEREPLIPGFNHASDRPQVRLAWAAMCRGGCWGIVPSAAARWAEMGLHV